MKYFLPLLFFAFLVSCSKQSVEPEKSIFTPQEQYISNFIHFERALGLKVRGYQQCGSTYLWQRHFFRLREGQLQNNQYFYSLEKRQLFTNSCGETVQETAWAAANGLYRYDFDQKIGYHYTGLSDQNPTILFDFNVAVGDVVLLDASHEAQLVVTSVTQEMIQNISFPVVEGQIVNYKNNPLYSTNDNVSNNTNGTVVLTPYSPNPFWFDQDLAAYSGIGWSEDDFCGYQDFSAFDGVELKTDNALTGNSRYYYTISGIGPF